MTDRRPPSWCDDLSAAHRTAYQCSRPRRADPRRYRGAASHPTEQAVWALSLLPALLALIFGFIGINTANRLGGKRRGLAIAAVVLGFAPVWVPFLRAALFGIA